MNDYISLILFIFLFIIIILFTLIYVDYVNQPYKELTFVEGIEITSIDTSVTENNLYTYNTTHKEFEPPYNGYYGITLENMSSSGWIELWVENSDGTEIGERKRIETNGYHKINFLSSIKSVELKLQYKTSATAVPHLIKKEITLH